MFDHVKGVLGRVQGMKSRICFRSKEGCTNRCLRINLSKICPPNRKRCSGYGHGYIPDGFEKQGTSVKISIKQLLHERHVFLGCLIFCYFYIPINRKSLVIFYLIFESYTFSVHQNMSYSWKLSFMERCMLFSTFYFLTRLDFTLLQLSFYDSSFFLSIYNLSEI